MKRKQHFEYGIVIIMMLVLFISSIFITNHFFKQEIVSQQEEYLQKKLDLLTSHLPIEQIFSKQSISAEDQTVISSYLASQDERLTLLSKEGQPFFDTNTTSYKNHSDRPEIAAILSGAASGSALRFSTTLNMELLYVALPIRINGDLIGIVRISEQSEQLSKSIKVFRQYILITIGILFLIITIFILLLIRQKNRPLVTVLPVLKNIVQHPDRERLIMQESDEWDELYQTINELSHQMSKTYLAYTSTEEQFHRLLDDLMIGIFIIDHENKVALINPKMCEILGINPPAQPVAYYEILKEPTLIHLIHQTISEKGVTHQEIHLSEPNDQTLDITLRYSELSEQNHFQLFGLAYDLTRVRQLEAMQRDFVSNVSHELKTPVTSLLGFTETLLDGAKDDPDALTQFLQIMQKDAERLQRLIQEILQLSRDGTTATGEQQQLTLKPFIQELVYSYQSQIDQKNLSISIIGEADLTYLTKLELFYPIVKNLIENAIQYSKDDGDIKISYQYADENLLLQVTDSGIGIDIEDQERIFERFYRVDKARSRHSGGTGLGLAIVQNYAELLGGTVSVTSHLGLGATFVVILPLRKEN